MWVGVGGGYFFDRFFWACNRFRLLFFYFFLVCTVDRVVGIQLQLLYHDDPRRRSGKIDPAAAAAAAAAAVKAEIPSFAPHRNFPHVFAFLKVARSLPVPHLYLGSLVFFAGKTSHRC